MKHALLTMLLLSGSAASAQTFGTIPEDLQGRLAARRPVLNGTDVSAALGTFRMDSPQLGCPMTVYGRFEDGALDIWSDGEDAVPRRRSHFHGEINWKPTYHFMDAGRSYDTFEHKGGALVQYLRAAVSTAESRGGRLDLYQETVTGSRSWREAVDSKPYLPSVIQLSVDAGHLTLQRKSYAWEKARVCAFRKVSPGPGPLALRVLPYAFEAKVRVGETAGTLRAAFDMDEFSDFGRQTGARNFTWTITLDDGRTLAEETSLPDGDWRKNKPGFVSPGMTQPDRESPFFVELEAGAYTKLAGREQLLRLFLECDEAMASCKLIPSVVTGSAAGFFAAPFSNFAKLADAPLTVEGGARIQLKQR